MNNEPVIPRGDGEYVFSPGDGSLAATLEENYRKLHRTDVKVSGQDLLSIRQSLKRKVLKMAQDYSGIEASKDQKILATGHQPIFYHPGILAKELLLERFVDNYVCINFSVDTDAASEIGVKVPLRRDNRYLQHQLVLIDNPRELIFGKLKTPSDSDLRDFAHMVSTRLKSLKNQDAKQAAEEFLEIAIDKGKVYGNYRDWMAFSRRDFVKSCYLELPISKVWKTEEAKLFIIDIVKRYEQFRPLYNQALKDYQEQYGSMPASKLQPQELPFWKVNPEGKREKAFLVDLNRIESIKGSTFYPRAVTLTLFCRLFLCDLFVHGVGGAKYDRATDQIIKGFYELTPPEYAFISLTLHLAEPKPAVEPSQIESLEEGLRTLEKNPERYQNCPGIDQETREGIQSLHLKKEDLVKELKSKGGEDKEQIEELNKVREELNSVLSGLKNDIKNRLKNLKRQLHSKEIIESRDYPFFFFPLKSVSNVMTEIFK